MTQPTQDPGVVETLLWLGAGAVAFLLIVLFWLGSGIAALAAPLLRAPSVPLPTARFPDQPAALRRAPR